jgi:hypothetical protein
MIKSILFISVLLIATYYAGLSKGRDIKGRAIFDNTLAYQINFSKNNLFIK